MHLLITPLVPLPKITKSLKGITARRANEALHLTGTTFWQEESYDHLVRGQEEFDRIRRYIERNPARAGLGENYKWATRGSPADDGVRPT